MTIDVRIMGVPERMDNIRQTQARLDISDSHIFIDTEHRGVVWNAKRAWLHPTDASHVLVLQDDIELCDDFLAICHRMVEAHPDKVFFLFPLQFMTQERLGGNPEQLRSPYVTPAYISGQGIIIPSAYIGECMSSIPPYAYADDTSIFHWAAKKGVDVLTTVPSTLQHIGDRSTIGYTEIRRTQFYHSNPKHINWDCRAVIDWREIYLEEPTETIALPVEIGGKRFELRTCGVRRKIEKLFRKFLTDKPANETVEIKADWSIGTFLQSIVNAISGYLINKDVLMLNAFAVSINGKGVLLIGDKRKSLAYLLKTARGYDVGVGMGDIQCVALTENGATTYPTPFGYIMKWEEKRVIHFDKILVVGDGSDQARELDSKEALVHIIRSAVLPKDMQGKLRAMQLCDQLSTSTTTDYTDYSDCDTQKSVKSVVGKSYSIDVRIMGVESRIDNIRRTQNALGVDDSHIFLDTERKGVIWNSKRTWLHPTDATHVLVLQDDIELCDGFMDICRRIVEAQPDKVISLFPFQFQREDSLLCGSANKFRTPYIEAMPVSGQGIIMPTKYVAECMESFPTYFVKRYYDTAIQEWAKSAEVQCITTLPAILQHIGDDSEIYQGAAPRRTAFYEQNPINVNWESRVVLPWRDVYKELPLNDISLNLEIADTVIELRTKGVERLVHGFFSQFIPEKPAAAILEVTDEWDPGNYRENFRLRVAEFLLERNILSLYARAVMVNDRGYLLVGDSKKVKEAAFRLKEQYKDECVVATGNAVCLKMSDDSLTAYPTPFTDKYPWEQKQHIRIERIVLLDTKIGTITDSKTDTQQGSVEKSVEGSVEPSIKDVFDALVHQLVMPDGVALKLKALTLVGDLAKVDTRIDNLTDTKIDTKIDTKTDK